MFEIFCGSKIKYITGISKLMLRNSNKTHKTNNKKIPIKLETSTAEKNFLNSNIFITT